MIPPHPCPHPSSTRPPEQQASVPRAMATPTPTLRIKTAARKLPIKRKTQQPSQLSDPDPTPSPSPNPNPIPQVAQAPKPDPHVSSSDNGYDDYYDEEEVEEQESEEFIGGGGVGEAGGVTGSGGNLKPPPFKFHRIWLESDEIRFLQGLLGCWSQGLAFPRDLNLFFDRFSESMPQPYTRSQLSEKLRRLRKKFRTMSARIARGQDPSRLVPHDRDLLHLCTRLWHPSHASSSPFSAPDAAPAGAVGNKRRRPNPRTPSASFLPCPTPQHQPPDPPSPPLALPTPSPPPVRPPPPAPDKADSHSGINDEKPNPQPVSAAECAGKRDTGHLLAKTVLDVFDGSLKELQAALLAPDHISGSGSSGHHFAKRWQEQRITELDTVACRLRLVLEESFRG